MKPSEFKQGKTYYGVMEFGEFSTLEKIVCAGRPRLSKLGSWFVPFHLYGNFASQPFELSLMDRNVPENQYNNHRIFSSRRKARSYLNRISRKCFSVKEQDKYDLMRYPRTYEPTVQDIYPFYTPTFFPVVVRHDRNVIRMSGV